MFVANLIANLISFFLAQYSRDCVMTIISVLEEPVYILLYKLNANVEAALPYTP